MELDFFLWDSSEIEIEHTYDENRIISWANDWMRGCPELFQIEFLDSMQTLLERDEETSLWAVEPSSLTGTGSDSDGKAQSEGKAAV